jgi:hypothetical protein
VIIPYMAVSDHGPTYRNFANGRMYLKAALQDPVLAVLEDDALALEIDPVKVRNTPMECACMLASAHAHACLCIQASQPSRGVYVCSPTIAWLLFGWFSMQEPDPLSLALCVRACVRACVCVYVCRCFRVCRPRSG